MHKFKLFAGAAVMSVIGIQAQAESSASESWADIASFEQLYTTLGEHSKNTSFQIGEGIVAYKIQRNAINLSARVDWLCEAGYIAAEVDTQVAIDAKNYFDGVVSFNAPFATAAKAMRATTAVGFQYAMMPKVCVDRIDGRLEPVVGYGFLKSGASVYLIMTDRKTLIGEITVARKEHQSRSAVGYDLGPLALERIVHTDGSRTYTIRAPVYSNEISSSALLAANIEYSATASIPSMGQCNILYDERIEAINLPPAAASVKRGRHDVVATYVNEAALPISLQRRSIEFTPLRSGPSLNPDRYITSFTPDDPTNSPLFAVSEQRDIDERHAVKWEMPAIQDWLQPRSLSLMNLGYTNLLHGHIVRDCERSRVSVKGVDVSGDGLEADMVIPSTE